MSVPSPRTMELTLSYETSAFILQTPGKFPKEHRLHSKHGESKKLPLYDKVVGCECGGVGTRINVYLLLVAVVSTPHQGANSNTYIPSAFHL